MRLIILCLIFVDFLKHLGNCCEIVDCGSIESDCVISPDYWLNNETFFLSAGCPDSYFKLDFEFDQNTDSDAIFIAWNYKLTIEDPQIEIENGTFTYDITAFFIILTPFLPLHNELGPFIDEVKLASPPFWRSTLFVSIPFGITNTNAKKKCAKVCWEKN